MQQNVHEIGGRGRIDAARGLIEQPQPPVAVQGTGDRDALAFATGEQLPLRRIGVS